MAVQRFKTEDGSDYNYLDDYSFKYGYNMEMNYHVEMDSVASKPLSTEYINDNIYTEKTLWSSTKINTAISNAISGGATGISNHNISNSAHLDIRILISNLVCDNSNVNLSKTTHNISEGIIRKGEDLFIHDFSYGDNGTVTPIGNNIFFGINAGNLDLGSTATNTYESSYNIGIGLDSLSSLVKGYKNIGVGARSLYSNTDGYLNVSIGVNSMNFNISGNRNIAIGSESLYNCNSDLNVAIGGESLYHCAEYSNVGVGFQSGRYYKDGGSFTALSNVRWSLFIGNYTMSGAPTGTTENEIVIGFQTVGNGSNTVTLGNDDITKTYLKGDVHTESGIKFGNVAEDGYMKVGANGINVYFDGAWYLLNWTPV